jgi:hypothetical protein
VTAGEMSIKPVSLDTLKDSNPNAVTILAKQWKIHENYNPDTRCNDIGLIQLPVSVPKNDNTAAAFLHFQIDPLPTGKCVLY